MDPIRLTRHTTSFTGEAGDEVLGSGYRLPEREPPDGAYRAKVAGVSHRRDELQLASFEPGCELKLVPEPDNPHDPDAVGVWDAAGEHQAGYLPRERARLIGRRLRRGNVSKAISLWEWKQAGSGERVALEILIAPDVPIEFED